MKLNINRILDNLLRKLFPNAINRIIGEANIIAEYGSIEAYHKYMELYLQAAREEDEYYQAQFEEDEYYRNQMGDDHYSEE